jgi:peptidoglycan/xylan/chitin deacetylase (PgdA/CDA1 family)
MKNFFKLTAYMAGVFLLPVVWLISQYGCNTDSKASVNITQPQSAAVTAAVVNATPALAVSNTIADAATILSRQQVPILCYHQIRDYKVSDSKTARDYIVPVASFKAQMQTLADSGYHSISPDQLYDYLTLGTPLPSKPVMITFDDSREDQYTAALPELNKHNFKAVFFIMTVALNKPGYMSKEQVKQLADEGHTVGSHTYDHKNVKTYTSDDWVDQIQKPSQQLQTITGKPVEYFAYPFGLWNKEAIAKLKDHDFKAVFQLAADRDENDPLYSIRRIIVPGGWSGSSLQKIMKKSFKQE